jgi:hypothetical protein
MYKQERVGRKQQETELNVYKSSIDTFIMFNVDVYHLHINEQCLIFAPSFKINGRF